jgi:aspartyl-tRNA(Asn)/glutamyl-tRNA(Gln) amidotransferase subunit A
LAGSDNFDATTSHKKLETTSLSEEKKYKIGLLRNAIHHQSIDSEVRDACLNMIEILKNNGHTVDNINFDELEYIVPTYYVLTTAEASSNLSRFDGIKYGFHAKEAQNLEETYTFSRTQGFGKEVQRRIMSGTFVLSAGYYRRLLRKSTKSKENCIGKNKTYF